MSGSMRWSNLSVSLIVAILAMSLPSAASASDPVAGPITIWADAAVSSSPQVVYNSRHNEFLVVWHNYQGPNSQDVFARRVGVDGELRPRFPIVVQAGEKHQRPVVAYNEIRDEYFVVWRWLAAADDSDLLGATVAWDGSTVSVPSWIVAAPGDQEQAQIAFNTARDEYLVVYTDRSGGGYWKVLARRLSGTGGFVGESIIASDSAADYWDPRVTYHPGLDQYLIAYYFDSVTESLVKGKTVPFDLTGAAALTELNLGSGTLSSWNPAISAGGSGFLAAWERSFKPRARQLASNGTPLGTSLGMLLGDTDSEISGIPSQTLDISFSSAVGFVVAWHVLYKPPSEPSYGDVHVRTVSATENALTSPQIVVADGPEDQSNVSIACTPWGVCLIAHETDDNIEAHLLVLRIHADGFESGNTSAWDSTIP